MAEKVRADLDARNYTLAESLVRGAEIEAGLDPGGFSIAGLRIFRASPTDRRQPRGARSRLSIGRCVRGTSPRSGRRSTR